MPTPCSVTGTLQTLTSGKIAQGKVIFQLTNIGTGNPISVSGTSIFPSLTVTVMTAQDGTFSTQLWGNDSINPANTLYAVTFRDYLNNEIGPVLFSISGASANLNLASPVNNVLPPVFSGAGTVGAVLLNPTASQTIAQPAGTGLFVNRFENARYADQFAGGDLGAKINAAVADIGSGNPGTIMVPDGGGTLSTVVTLGKNHNLVFGAGTYTTAGINLPDSTTDTTGVSGIFGKGKLTTLILANVANRDVITNTNFATLTGTANNFGIFHTYIQDLIVDGNKANNTSGYGIRVYGRASHFSNLVVQNAAQDGMWTEWGGVQGTVGPANENESTFSVINTQFNAGSGWTHKGPNDSIVNTFVSWSNGKWGWDVMAPTHAYSVNTYFNDLTTPGTTGGIHTSAGGQISGSDIIGSTSTGWGMLIDTTSGSNEMAASSHGSAGTGVALEVRSVAQQFFSGVLNSSNVATCTGLKLNGAGQFCGIISFIACPGPRINFVSESLPNTIIATSDGTAPATWFTGTPTIGDTLLLGNIPGFGHSNINQFQDFSFLTSLTATESTVPSGAAGKVVCYADPTAHAFMASYNNDAFKQVSRIIASGTSTLTVNAALTAVTSQTAITTAATGALATDAIEWAYASAPGAGDSLCIVSAYVTAGNVNFVRSNPTAANQSVSAIVINWRVVR